jgi:hypothetical protein
VACQGRPAHKHRARQVGTECLRDVRSYFDFCLHVFEQEFRCSNGCGMDIGVKDGKIVGVRGRECDRSVYTHHTYHFS